MSIFRTMASDVWQAIVYIAVVVMGGWDHFRLFITTVCGLLTLYILGVCGGNVHLREYWLGDVVDHGPHRLRCLVPFDNLVQKREKSKRHGAKAEREWMNGVTISRMPQGRAMDHCRD